METHKVFHDLEAWAAMAKMVNALTAEVSLHTAAIKRLDAYIMQIDRRVSELDDVVFSD